MLQVGLVEKEWLDTLATINPDEVTFLNFVEAGEKLGAQLKQEVRTMYKYIAPYSRQKKCDPFNHYMNLISF